MSGAVVWITGRPASGKSTLARAARDQLRTRGACSCVLDGDDVRASVLPPRGYDPADRDAHYGTLARLAALLAEQGLVVIVPATANRRAYRQEARARAPRFLEVLVEATEEECAARDVKGLYARARAGEVERLPGVGAAYEPPAQPDVRAAGGRDEAAASAIARWAADASE